MSQVKNKFLAQMSALTIKGNNTGSTANPLDLTVAQVNTMLGDILSNGTVAMTAALNMGTNQITNVGDPTSAQMAATKNYVDTQLAQLNPYDSVYAATIGSNIAGTYLNGVAGVGATLTTTATGTFTLDGTTPPLGARILIKNQSSGFQNGVYTITTLGTTGISTVFTRALDFDTASDMNAGNPIPVINGTVNAGSSWYQTATITTVGTDSLSFSVFTLPSSSYLQVANNLSDVASKSTSFNNISPITTTGDIVYSASGATNSRLGIGSTGQVLTVVGGLPAWASATSGTVTSVALTVPSFLSVSGSPITGSGTLAVTLSGTALPVANGGTGDTSLTAYAVLCGGTTSTAAVQSIASVGTTGQVLTSNGATALPTFQAAAAAWTTSSKISNAGFSTSESASALTIALKQQDGSTDPSTGTAAVVISFRSSTAANGSFNERSVTGALSIVVSSGATLGHVSATNEYVYLWAIDNAGTVELAVSGSYCADEGSVVSTTVMNGSSTSRTTLYSTTARTGVPVRFIGRFKSNQTTAGTWAQAILEYSPLPADHGMLISNAQPQMRMEYAYITNNGTAAISTQSGSWITSVSRTSQGAITINIATGMFSSAPICVGSPAAGSGNTMDVDSTSTSAITTSTRSGANTNADVDIMIMVMGPR